MASTRICVLGPLTVDGNAGGLAPRDRVVMAALALHPGEVVSAERLADALWGGQPPASWKKVVPGCVMRLRRVLGVDSIETVPDGYRLVVSGEEVDAQRFERLVGRAQQLLTLGEPERAAHVAGEALALWRGRPLGDLDDWDTGELEVVRLEELRRDAEELHLDAALRAGHFRDVLGEAQARVAEAPLREQRWALLATAQYQAGRQGDALRTLHRARTVLATELGVDPGPDLVALERAILNQDPSLVAREAGPEPMAICPYRGLVAYDVEDADEFFGRDADVTACLHRLATVGVLAVVGPSGSGKSSLVRAGVAAALVRDGRQVVIIAPGAHPMEALATIRDTRPDTVLVVDQCEQAASLCSDAGERSRFFAAVAEHALRTSVVVAIRADRLTDATTQPDFARLVERGLHLLGPMAEPDLRAAIGGPAHQAGLLLEAGLIDLLVREVEGEPGALPLLSHALRQTWERREGRTLTVSGYQATGGIRGAISRTAEELYERVPPDRRAELRDLLLRLVGPDIDGEPVSTPVPRRSLVAGPEHDHLIDQLVDARLVTSDDGVIELSHESLARAWPRMRGWLDDDADGQRTFRHLAGAADAWESMGRPETELYRGVRLWTTLEWQARTHPNLTVTERQFLDDGRDRADAEATRERRHRRRRRSLVAAVAVLVVAGTLAGVQAKRQADRAEGAAVTADARRAAALARDAPVDQALLLAVEAVRLRDSRETRDALLGALSISPALIGSYRHDPGAPSQAGTPVVALAPDGEVLIAADGVAAAAHDADTLEIVRTFDAPPSAVVYRPDGVQVALSTHSFGSEGSWNTKFDTIPVRLLDAATLEPEPVQLGGWPAGKLEAWDLDYSADGRRLAANLCVMHDWDVWDFTCTAMVWDPAAPEHPVQTIEIPRTWGIALSGDGRLLYVGSYELALDVYDVETGAFLRSRSLTPDYGPTNPTGDSPSDTLEISPDGSTVAIRELNDIVLLDATTLTEQARMTGGHTTFVEALEFSHDGTRLASGSDDGAIIVWDIATGSQVEQLRGHTASTRALEFSPDDGTLYSTAEDRGILVWDLDGARRFLRRLAPVPVPDHPASDALSTMLAFPSRDGEAVVSFSRSEGPNGRWGDTLRFLDVPAGRVGDAIVTDHTNWPVGFRPGGFDEFATTDGEGFIRLWDWRRGTLTLERHVASSSAALSYSADGREIIGLDPEGSVFRVDADTLEPTGERIPLREGSAATAGTTTGGFPNDGLALSPDGRTAFVTPAAGTAAWIDLIDGRVLRRLDLRLGPARASFSPDGHRVAITATSTGEVGLLDLGTWAWTRPPIAAHSGQATGATWAPDGKRFQTTGTDGRISLWNGRTGEQVGALGLGNPGSFMISAYLPDAHTVMVATPEDVLVWDTRLEEWIEQACGIAGRNLTAEEWSDAFGDRPYHHTCLAG